MTESGTLEAIWIKTGEGGPMDPRDHARLEAGQGLEGNADRGGRRQVTILDRAAWEAAVADLGVEVEPWTRRANLFTSGVSLPGTKGRVLRVGNCRIHIRGETKPCSQMDDAVSGLKEALVPEWRGGVYGEVLDDGEIRIGDALAWVEE